MVMTNDTEVTKVIFRKFKDGYKEVIALFPEIPGTTDPYTCLSYMRVGQHSSASVGIIDSTTLAKPEEYADLKEELERIGYVLDVRKKHIDSMLNARRKELNRIGEEQ